MRQLHIFILSIFILLSCERQNTLLKDFVQKEDDAFRFEIINVVEGDSWKEYIVKMVSQEWLTSNDVEETEWWHWVRIVVPNDVEESEALFFIGGGSHKSKAPASAEPALVQIALATKSIVADISNIPFQSLIFKNDDFGERYEDDIIAFGWRQFVENGAKDQDAKWLAHLPMTKAVVRGMDVIQEISKLENKSVDRFVTAGGSKRGWTTWCTAIADDRIMAIIPIVIDMLNVEPSFNHHWKCYGAWSHAIDSYVNEGVMDWMGSKEYHRINEIVEPFSFREQLTLPKFLINATGDEFFVTDSWQFYWDELQGEKYLQYIPNANHGLRTNAGEYNMKSLTAFYKAVISDSDRPQYNWHVSNDSIYLNVDHTLNSDYSIKQWEAVNNETRDFRVDVIGRSWISTDIPKSANGRYAVKIAQPENGYKAGLLEVTFNPESDIPFTFTSGTVVSPNTFPFGDYVSKNPKGTR
jgi:PhoPQ-activated pathogenicity-related protein